MNIIEKVLFINLESRPDRMLHVEGQLKQFPELKNKVERFNAIKLPNGRLGCSMSHLKCLQRAKKEGWKNVFICEDDIMFTKPEIFAESFQQFIADGHNWDVIVVGGNACPPFKSIHSSSSESVIALKIEYCQTTTGYIVASHYYDTLIANYREGIELLMRNSKNHFNYAIDKYWIQLQKRDNWYFIMPPTVIQIPNYSDIEEKVTDYSQMLLDPVKKEFFESQGYKLIETRDGNTDSTLSSAPSAQP